MICESWPLRISSGIIEKRERKRGIVFVFSSCGVKHFAQLINVTHSALQSKPIASQINGKKNLMFYYDYGYYYTAMDIMKCEKIIESLLQFNFKWSFTYALHALSQQIIYFVSSDAKTVYIWTSVHAFLSVRQSIGQHCARHFKSTIQPILWQSM